MLTFKTKAEYLIVKAKWAADFKAHLSAVRAAKIGIKLANRAYSRRQGDIPAIWNAYSVLRQLHADTDKLLMLRAKMRALAHEQYTAASIT